MAIASNFPTVDPSLLLDFANTKRLDSRITFTRTTTATYYDGVTTAKAEENLLLQSQDFTTTWGATNITVTANSVAAPDGTMTAETIDDGTATAVHNVNEFVNGTLGTSTYVFSCFLKNVDRQFASLAVSSSPTTYVGAKFDLVAGTAGSTAASGAGWSVTSSSITSAGGGWYRCVLVFVPDIAGSFTVRVGTATDSTTFTASERGLQSYTGTNKQIYIWGAQLEQRSSVTAYTATTTQAITNYIPVLLTAASGVARFQHNPTTDESLGLLIEEARTNLALRSDDFANATWVKAASSITSNTIVAPDGTLTGDKLVEDTTNANHTVRQPITVTSGATYTSSCFIKAGERTECAVEIFTGATVYRAVFNLLTGAFISSTGTGSYNVSSVGNGWFRISITAAASTTTLNPFIYTSSGGNTTYTGDGYSGIYIWGAQVELGAFPTSYIATTAATVTRNADAASMTGSNFTSWYNAAEGTVYVEAQTAATNGGFMTLQDGSVANYMRLNRNSSNSKLQVLIENSSGVQANIASVANVTVNTFVKGTLSYKFNDAAVCLNSESAVTDTSVVLPNTPTELNIGFGKYLTYVNGTIKKLAYYQIRLTNANLQALTS